MTFNRPGRPGRPYLMTPRGLVPKRSAGETAAIVVVGVVIGLVLIVAFDLALAAIAMLIFGLLNQQISTSIPAFGFWQCFVLLIALSFFKVMIFGVRRTKS